MYIKRKGRKCFLSQVVVIILFFTFILIEGFCKGECIWAKEGPAYTKGKWNIGFGKEAGNGSSVDGRFLSLLEEGVEKSKTQALLGYEQVLREQMEEQFALFRSKCKTKDGRKALDEYQSAVSSAVDAQKKLMDYMAVGREKNLWYSVQIYQCALGMDMKGEPYYGQNPAQEDAALALCNQLGLLTMEFYEQLDEEGSRLAGIWQESRERWKEASGRCQELLDSRECGDDGDGQENGRACQETQNGRWINQLYYQQLQLIMKEGKVPEILQA